MKVENQKPWLFEINNLDSNKINPFLSDSSYLTIEFKVENFYDNEKLGFLGMPGKNFGISYDFEVETFVFEFWTKGLNGRDNFHCYKDFHINRIDVENGLVLTIHYDKEKNILELYHDFNIFFDVELDGPLIEDYYTQPLYFGCHNPDADNHKHKCFTELDLKHFSIFNGEVNIEDVEKFYNSKNLNDNLLCYFDLKEKYLVHKEDYNYFLIQNQKDKLINISLSDLNVSVADRIKLKRKRVPGLKIEHKKPFKLKTNLESNLLTNRDFSLNIIFKIERHFTQDEKIGFFGIPGKNFGISFDYEVEKFVFEYWTQKDEENKEFNCHKNYKINRNDLHNGITISLIYKKNEYFELYHNFKLIDKIEVKDNLISEYNTEPIYFGCHNPSSLLENHKCFTEMELNHFSVYDGVMDIADLEKLTKTDNSLTYFNFKKTDNIGEIFDNLNKETSIELVDLLTFKTMVDFNLVKEKLNKVGCGFCLAKWTQVTMHLHNGTTHSCHHPEPHKIGLDEIKRNPTALHNSNVKKRARKEMLENKRPSECNYCWNVEDHSDSFSDRFFKSAEPWSEPHFDEIANLHWRDNYNPKYVEVNFSNTCNFKCAYCGPEYSTKWMEEINEHGGYMLDTHEFNGLRRMEERNTKPYKQTDENPYVEAFWEWFPELYSTLDTFRITGGEPLLSKDTWKVLDFILETDTPNENLKLSINSNLGVSDELIDKLILKLEKIIAEGRVKEVILFTSCEGYGKQAEYTRFGLEFDRLFSNIDKILTVLDKVTIVVMSTFNMFSIFSYEKLIKKIHSFKLKHFNTSRYWNSAVILDTSYLRHPSFMSFRVLKDYIDVEYFNRWLKYMKFNSTYRSINFYEQQTIEDVGFSTQEIEKISRIKDIFITDYDTDIKEFDSSKRDFIKFIDEYEKRRGVNCEEYYPELINFIKQVRNDNKL